MTRHHPRLDRSPNAKANQLPIGVSAPHTPPSYSEVWAAMSVIGAPWWPVTGGRWLAAMGLGESSCD
jgi:hypothetical protein